MGRSEALPKRQEDGKDEAERNGRGGEIEIEQHCRRHDGDIIDKGLHQRNPSLSMPRPTRRVSASKPRSLSQVTRM